MQTVSGQRRTYLCSATSVMAHHQLGRQGRDVNVHAAIAIGKPSSCHHRELCILCHLFVPEKAVSGWKALHCWHRRCARPLTFSTGACAWSSQSLWRWKKALWSARSLPQPRICRRCWKDGVEESLMCLLAWDSHDGSSEHQNCLCLRGTAYIANAPAPGFLPTYTIFTLI